MHSILGAAFFLKFAPNPFSRLGIIQLFLLSLKSYVSESALLSWLDAAAWIEMKVTRLPQNCPQLPF